MSFKTLIQSDESRKIFGKREIEIIVKQISGGKLTQSEKNRLSRDIRKKLTFMSHLCKFQNDFKLSKNQSTKKKIKQIVDSIIQDSLSKRIKAILLFGSHANGSNTVRSDIDICVVFDKINLKESTSFRIRLSTDPKIDIQVFNILPAKIKKTIAANHKVLYQKDFNDLEFTLRYLKTQDYFIRLERIFGSAS